jgi:peptide-methionine (S)-S-oxide reductase
MGERIAIIAGIAFIALILLAPSFAGDTPKRASTLNGKVDKSKLATATFAGGCFWHIEDSFRSVEGVVSTEVGFEGGWLRRPSYEDVCTDRTGHAEVVRVRFDPAKVSYEKLLQKFFEIHDPTTVNRQGLDFGTQYRSVIFYDSPEQRKEAGAFKAKLQKSGMFSRPIVTEIVPVQTFWRAEEYHQHYDEKQRGEMK